MIRFILLIIPFLFFSCSGSKKETADDRLIFTDDLGRKVILKAPPKRIMALAPSMTEMLYAVCPDSMIVGRTHACNFPKKALEKPVVKTYPFDYESIILIKPDLVFSIEGMTSLEDAARLESLGIPVYYQKYETVDDILKGLKNVGEITKNVNRAEKLVDSLTKIQIGFQKKSDSITKRPKVLVITWHDPIYVYGKNTFMTDKLRLAGAENAVDGDFAVPFPELSREYVLKINPDVIIGGTFERADSTFFRLYPELKRINAYKNRRIYLTDDDLTSRPSPRVFESVAELRKLIHGF